MVASTGGNVWEGDGGGWASAVDMKIREREFEKYPVYLGKCSFWHWSGGNPNWRFTQICAQIWVKTRVEAGNALMQRCYKAYIEYWKLGVPFECDSPTALHDPFTSNSFQTIAFKCQFWFAPPLVLSFTITISLLNTASAGLRQSYQNHLNLLALILFSLGPSPTVLRRLFCF